MVTLALLIAMGGVQPEGMTEMATRACIRRMAQMAASYGALDISSHRVGETQLIEGDRTLVQLNITIRYRRRMGIIEPRTATVGCIVNRYGKVEAISEPVP